MKRETVVNWGWRVGRDRMEGRDQGVGSDCWTSCGRRALIGPNVYRARVVLSGARLGSLRVLILCRHMKESGQIGAATGNHWVGRSR
jgi:hypothetical protein